MPAEFPGWLSAPDAVKEYGIDYKLLRRLVHKGVLTRGNFSDAEERPPIYVRVAEMDAWKSGGIAAVEAVKASHSVGA